jgi:hypothetical protein
MWLTNGLHWGIELAELQLTDPLCPVLKSQNISSETSAFDVNQNPDITKWMI